MRSPMNLARLLLRSRTAWSAAVLLLLGAAGRDDALAQAGRFVAPRPFVAGQAIVWAQPGTDMADVTASANAAGCDIARPMRTKDMYVLTVRPKVGAVATDAEVLSAVRALRAAGPFRWAGPNLIMAPLDSTPNDPRYGEQWHHAVLNTPKAWDLERGQPNVIVAVLDTGCDINHQDLKDRIVGARNFTDPNAPNDVTDNAGHGTHVAGIAAASTSNGIGVAGIAWENVGVFVAKCGDPFFYYSDTIDAITYIRQNVNTAGKRVVMNMSFGGPSSDDTADPNDPVGAALVAAANEGIVTCIAAGNSYEDGNPPFYPAKLCQLNSAILCVASVGPTKQHAPYSSARPYTTVAATGGDQSVSASGGVLSTVPGNGYDFYEGTSMASPSCAGVVALLMSSGAPTGQVRDILTSTADTGGQAVPNAQYGYGIIDAYAALVRARMGLRVTTPVNGSYVYGNVPVQLAIADQSKLTSAALYVDGGTTAIASTNGPPYLMTWASQDADPQTGAPKYANGSHALKVVATTAFGPVTFNLAVRLDNPIAKLTSPAVNTFITKTVGVMGTADGLRRPFYTLEYGRGSSPTVWTPILTDANARVQGGSLGSWDLTAEPVSDGQVALRLRVRNPDGFEVSAASPLIVDQTPPTTPANLHGTATHRQTTLTWDASTEVPPALVGGYNLYRSDKSLTGYTKQNAVAITTTSYTDANLVNGQTYFYKIAAVDAAGNESAPTPFLDLTPNRNGTASGQVIALDGTYIQGATVSLLQSGAPVPTVPPVQTDSAGQYQFPAPPGFDPGTYQLRISATGYVPQLVDDVTVALGKDAPGRDAALQLQPAFPTGWSMFTLPYDFHGAAIDSIVSDGGATPEIRYYDPLAAKYLKPTEQGFPKPAPGTGYWIYRAGNPTIVAAGTPNAPVVPVDVAIHPGWNLLGNPFQDPIRWVLGDMIITRSDTGEKATLSAAVLRGWTLDFGWGGPNGRTLLYDQSILPGISNAIPGYGAFWFYSTVEGTMSIVPPRVIGRSASTAAAGWALQLNATSGGQTASVYLGLAGTAKRFAAPPLVEGTLQLGFATGLPSVGRCAVDLRAASGVKQTYEIVIEGAADQPVTLTWPAVSCVPRGWTLRLADPVTGHRVSLRNASSYTLAPSRAPHQLQLELTRDTGGQLGIYNLTAASSRSASSVISFTVGRDAQAMVTIIGPRGNTVRSLVSRSVQAGTSSFVWDTKDNTGRSLPSGVYLIQVRAVSDDGDSARAVLPFVITR